MFKELLQKEWFRLLGVLLIGITIGVIFYPTKRIEEKMTLKYEQEIAAIKEQHNKEVSESETKWLSLVNEARTLKIEAEQKVSKLQEEVKTLQSKQKTETYKLVKPDGTIEERTFTESEVNESSKVVTQIQEEFNAKIEQIETKWSMIHQERVAKIQKEFDSKESDYKKTIQELQQSKTVSVNEKRFGLEVGITNEKNYYGHATMDVWGPTFIGVHGQIGANGSDANNMGIGLGLRF